MTPEEIAEKYPDAYWQGFHFVMKMAAAIAALEAGDTEAAESDPSCNGWTVGCPS